MKLRILATLCLTLIFQFSQAQNPNRIAQQLQEKINISPSAVTIQPLLVNRSSTLRSANIENEVKSAGIYKVDLAQLQYIQAESPELLHLSIPGYQQQQKFDLQLFKADVFTDEFQVIAASDRSQSFPYEKGEYYWGIIDGDQQSIASLAFHGNEMSGFLYKSGETFNIGKLRDGTIDEYIIFKESDLRVGSPLGCEVDDTKHVLTDRIKDRSRVENPNNCVNMYIEVDYDIFVGKGGVQQAADYVNAAFSQVAILYANESINFRVNEILVWDIVDPYTGTSTSNYLSQFRSNLGGVFNGDLAHLVGYQGSGGIAYVDVLCNKSYGVGYSDINSSFNNVPTYSWTVEVLTHEIGHNLGSRHTHNCVWNGNNTAIDRCGPAAGYDAAACNADAPIPNAGTIMSYCHLVGGVGIDFNLGFGPQPGDLIRNRVYNASCLTACSDPVTDDAGISAVIAPVGDLCDSPITPEVELTNYGTATLTSVTITYTIDGSNTTNFNWTGSLASATSTNVTLPSFTTTNGSHSFEASTSNPNGATDENLANDSSSSSFNKQDPQTYYADADNDGFGDPASPITACTQPNGYVINNGDCNPGDGNIYPGGTCNDGSDCTTGDTYDSNCNCVGTYTDSDGDGVCDANDICPGGDDNIDTDGDGTPDFCDCNAATASFTNDPLTHNGGGNSSTTYTFSAGDKDVGFTVSGMNAKTNGNPNNRYEEVVSITYVDGNGSQNYGTFSGANQASVSVSISGEVQSVTVSLSDGQNTNTGLSVDLSVINYCSGTSPCADADNDGVCDIDDVCPDFNDNLIGTSCNDNDPCTENDVWGTDCNCAGTYTDSDGDGVCDADDICPGGDDNIDTDNDGIPDFCDSGDCSTITSNFSPDPLSHSGNGNSETSVTFPAGNRDVSFTINGLDAVSNGKPDGRYTESVTVTYIDGNGIQQNAGTFNGDVQTSATVNINGEVQSVTLTLSDGYDGNAPVTLSIDPSDVTSCAPTGATLGGEISSTVTATIYPNPARELIWVQLENEVDLAQVTVTNLLGQILMTRQIVSSNQTMIPVREFGSKQQLILVYVNIPGQDPIVQKVMIVK